MSPSSGVADASMQAAHTFSGASPGTASSPANMGA